MLTMFYFAKKKWNLGGQNYEEKTFGIGSSRIGSSDFLAQVLVFVRILFLIAVLARLSNQL